jgi:hypothetical protein
MTRYNLIQSSIVAAVLATVVLILGAPAQGADNSTSFVTTLAPPLQLHGRSTSSKSTFVELGADGGYQDAVVQKYGSEGLRQATQGWSPHGARRFTVVNETPEPLWIWLETTLPGFPIFTIPNPDARWVPKIKIHPGESLQISNMPTHTGAIRAYARCDERGLDCASEEGAATKWEYTFEPGGKPNLVGINLSLGMPNPTI